jgi:hypothetical protein
MNVGDRIQTPFGLRGTVTDLETGPAGYPIALVKLDNPAYPKPVRYPPFLLRPEDTHEHT